MPTTTARFWQNDGGSLFYWVGASSAIYTFSTPTVNYNSFAGSLAIAASYAAGISVITVSGFPVSAVAMMRGDLIEIDEHLYMLAQPAVADAGGIATMTLSDPLVTSINGTSVVKIIQPACKMRLNGVSWGTSRQWDGAIATASAKFIEVA